MEFNRPEAEQQLQQKVISAGIEPGAFFARLEDTIRPSPDPARAYRNLLRFLEAGFTSSLLYDFSSQPFLLGIFIELVGQSQYLADILVRNPAWLHWLTSTGELRRIKSMGEIRAEALAAISAFEQPGRRRDALKRFHRREMLRIGAMDILGNASLQEIVGQLSALADVIIDEAVAASFEAVLQGSRRPAGAELCVIGLGKLGGGELNFSSDIDLMFVYEQDRDLRNPVGRLGTVHELCVRLSENVVDFLSGFSEEGYFYRVDMRLRPDGKSGPLALSRAGYMAYYETRGEPWERQMLIKARVVGGDPRVGERFLSDIRPFVFRRTLITSPWSDIASMKRAIEAEFHSSTNIKLGAGGIRDIEFLVQGLQLVHAGRHPGVRSPNTLRAIDALEAEGLLPDTEADVLREAYSLFRDVEHRLQLFHASQTHDLPVDDEEFSLLGRKLGHSAGAFRRLLTRHRSRVRRSFLSATAGMPGDTDEAVSDAERAMSDALRSSGEGGICRRLLSDVRRDALGPVAAQRLGVLLDDPARSSVLREGLRSSRLRSDLVTALGRSSIVFERFSTDPLLLESLVGQAASLLRGRQPGWSDLLTDDPARFRRYNEVRSAIRFLTGRTTVRQFEKEMTAVAELILLSACNQLALPETLLIVGAGKLGSGEMGISSDLDLLLFYKEGLLEAGRAQELGESLRRRLAGEKKSYDVDLRLRPEGRNAPLVSGTEYFAEYMRSRADVWERMALGRSRPLWGSQDLRTQYSSSLRKAIGPSVADVVAEARSMRGRMEAERGAEEGIDVKIAAGGIADIEFLAQIGSVLRNRYGGRPTVDSLRQLRRIGEVREREVHILADALAFLRTVETVVRLNSAVSTSVLKPSHESAVCATHVTSSRSIEELLSTVRRRMSSVRRVFDGVLDRWGGN